MANSVTHDVIQNLKTKQRLGATRAHTGPAKSDVTQFGADGWRDLGAGNPGSFDFDFPKEIYMTDTGLPVTTKGRDIVGWAGTVQFELYEYTSIAADQLIGTDERTDYVAATGADAFSGTVETTGSTRTLIAINGTNPIINSLFVGETIAVVMGTAADASGQWKEASRIIEVNTSADTVIVEGDGFSVIPPAGATVYKVEREDTLIGGNNLEDKRFRTVTSLTNGEMFVLYMEKGNFIDPFKINTGDGKSAIMLPGAFSAIGVAATTTCNPTEAQVHVARHSIIRKLGAPPAGCV